MKKISQYIYTIYVVTIFIITFIIQLPVFLLLSLFGKKKDKYIYVLIRLWSRVFFFLAVITVRVYGREKLEKDKKYVIIANHYSFLDTPMIFASLPYLVKPLARSDYGRIPLFGMIYRAMSIPVDRSSNSSKKVSYQLMVNAIKEDDSHVFIFPEGSFNETDLILKPFYNGAFNLAQDTQSEIIPILFPDTIKRWNFRSFWAWSPGVSRAYILDPIDIETINSMNVSELKDHIHDIMQTHLGILSNT